MSTIDYIPDPLRTQFTYYGLNLAALMQVKEFSEGTRDVADGEGFALLVGRKMCDETGKFKLDRLEAQSLVAAAYAEGWHEKYGQ